MIFAALDYLDYRNGRARYSDTQSDAAMGALSFVNEIPESQIQEFATGDMIFTQRLNSFMSWGMMYVTSSSVDHAALYFGDGKVAHRTLTGGRLHSIRSFAKDCRIIVLRMSEAQRADWSHQYELLRPLIYQNPFIQSLPPKVQLIGAGFLCIHGRFPDRFRWRMWIEFFLTLFLLSVLGNYFFNLIILLSLPVCSLAALLFFRVSASVRRAGGKPSPIMSHPDVLYRLFFKVGGLMFTRQGPLAVTELGILPLKVFSLAREGPNDGADDEFKETREFFRYLLKGWDIEAFAKQAEYDDANQKKD